MFGKKQLNLSPGFQRRSVWSLGDRRLLIQSLVAGIPLPSVYLYKQQNSKGTLTYDVIDGKQRIETLLYFIGKGPLHSSEPEPLWVKLPDGDDSNLVWTTWQMFSKNERAEFLGQRIPVIEVSGELHDVVNLFVRINSTGKRLDGQEKRHAQYFTSPLLKAAQRAAEEFEGFYLKNGVLAPAQIQRMRHVELTTELILYGALGGHPNKKTQLDKVIQGDLVSTETIAGEVAELRRDFRVLGGILPDLRATRFRKIADFYSLVTLLRAMREEGLAVNAHTSARNKFAGDLLREFGRDVDLLDDQSKRAQISKGSEAVQSYLLSVRGDTDSARTRNRREKLLREVLYGVFDEKDGKRTFNATQRRILWHGSASKSCSICGSRVTRWEDLAIDHVRPYVVGGQTKLSNAAIAHKWCNSAKGAR
jgi:5-methylcytosine-specific restriction endonuclease McrA